MTSSLNIADIQAFTAVADMNRSPRHRRSSILARPPSRGDSKTSKINWVWSCLTGIATHGFNAGRAGGLRARKDRALRVRQSCKRQSRRERPAQSRSRL